MSVNFMDLKPNYETSDKYAKFDMVAFPIVQANLIIKLKNELNTHEVPIRI